MKALVTGVAGFVGSAIAKRLVADGHQVTGVDALTDYYPVELKQANLEKVLSSRFQFVRGDLNELDLESMLEDVDWVFHQAGQPGVRMSWGSEFAQYTKQNIGVTQRLLEAASRSARIKRFVYASSSSVYGNAIEYPTLESALPRPISPYGVTKLAAEHLCSLYGGEFGVPTVSLRYFTVYGPGQRPDMAFTRFLRAALTGDEIAIYGTGKQIRDFTYIDDVVEANILAATVDGVPPGSVFNVAGGSNISVNEILELIATLSERPLNVRRIAAVAGDVFRTGGSTEAISQALGWAPIVAIEDGLARQFDWIRSLDEIREGRSESSEGDVDPTAPVSDSASAVRALTTSATEGQE